MNFIAITEEDRKHMLREIGVNDIKDLFKDIPENIRRAYSLELPEALSEIEVEKLLKKHASGNTLPVSFVGAGVYQHQVPAVVDALASRSEFYTAYTPYQPEVSQGTLTAIFEFQTMISNLTGMDATNASMYDGATALAESVMMASAHTKKNRIAVSGALHPNYLHVLRTYAWASDMEVVVVGMENGVTSLTDMENLLDDSMAACVVQYPNFLGCIEDLSSFSKKAREKNVLFIVAVNEMMCLGLLKPPGEFGADIVCGEAQSFGNYPAFGGPMVGFISVRKEFLRKIPGRLVGKTTDVDGKEAYVLTLQTREQHIRREKATSNICTNEGLMALRSVMYLSLIGPRLTDIARLNHSLASYLKSGLLSMGFTAVFQAPFFNEFVIKKNNMNILYEKLKSDGFILGLNLEAYGMKDCMLVCVTEYRTRDEIDSLLSACKKAIS
ncbi:MAG: aminomethyl-transferring glycine dehydrogenase [Spirochaetae bacterium HGW-Spirochaetae-1]|jgi:glycine dehydrogenase subunit 1|nr:MAG: aminomethyl-transferring glycine dehydrogenase [Spirochaetae bacterium HGW-Spirochaetae-1]